MIQKRNNQHFRRLLLLTFICVVQPIGAEQAIDQATLRRNATLYEYASNSSDHVAELVANSAVDIYERNGLWVRLKTTETDAPVEGWIRFTELRFGNATVQSSAAKSTSRSGGFAGFSRSVSGFLSGFRSRNSRTASNSTSTIGIRGLTVAELETARPDPNALASVSRYVASEGDAQAFAGASGLVARNVPYKGGR